MIAMSHTRVFIHYVWSPARRSACLKGETRSRLLYHIRTIARKKGIKLLQINCVDDHCHALIELGPTHTVARVAFSLKGESSRWINKNRLMETHFAWQKDYYAESVSRAHVKRVWLYIAKQQIHHTPGLSPGKGDNGNDNPARLKQAGGNPEGFGRAPG
jgi:putative transposase